MNCINVLQFLTVLCSHGTKSSLHLSEHVSLLPSGVSDEFSVDIVRVLGGPADEGLISVSDSLERDLTNDAADGDGGLSHDELVGESVVSLAEFGDTVVPG